MSDPLHVFLPPSHPAHRDPVRWFGAGPHDGCAVVLHITKPIPLPDTLAGQTFNLILVDELTPCKRR